MRLGPGSTSTALAKPCLSDPRHRRPRGSARRMHLGAYLHLEKLQSLNTCRNSIERTFKRKERRTNKERKKERKERRKKEKGPKDQQRDPQVTWTHDIRFWHSGPSTRHPREVQLTLHLSITTVYYSLRASVRASQQWHYDYLTDGLQPTSDYLTR